MRGRGGSNRSNSNGSGSGTDNGLLGATIGYVGGNMAGNNNDVSLGDGVKYQVKCTVDDQSEYCQNVRSYNQFQMFIKMLTSVISIVLLFVALYYIYKIYKK